MLGKRMTKPNDKKETTPIATKCSRDEIMDIGEEGETMP
jgi:hypothetical protein